jgi:hypothetical protein
LTILPAETARDGPRWPHDMIAVLRLEQEWTMFAPCPARDDGWFVMRGVLVDGSEVNLWEPQRELSWAKPQLPSAHFPNHRWRKYLSNFRWNQDTEQLSCFSDWLRARWDDSYSGGRPEREVELVQIIFFLEETPPPGKPPRPPKPDVLWHWNYKLPDEQDPLLPEDAKMGFRLPAPSSCHLSSSRRAVSIRLAYSGVEPR